MVFLALLVLLCTALIWGVCGRGGGGVQIYTFSVFYFSVQILQNLCNGNGIGNVYDSKVNKGKPCNRCELVSKLKCCVFCELYLWVMQNHSFKKQIRKFQYFLFQLNSAVTRAFGQTPTNLCGTPSWKKELMEKSQANKKRNEVTNLL